MDPPNVYIITNSKLATILNEVSFSRHIKASINRDTRIRRNLAWNEGYPSRSIVHMRHVAHQCLLNKNVNGQYIRRCWEQTCLVSTAVILMVMRGDASDDAHALLNCYSLYLFYI